MLVQWKLHTNRRWHYLLSGWTVEASLEGGGASITLSMPLVRGPSGPFTLSLFRFMPA
jgi:hypothetical protein